MVERLFHQQIQKKFGIKGVIKITITKSGREFMGEEIWVTVEMEEDELGVCDFSAILDIDGQAGSDTISE